MSHQTDIDQSARLVATPLEHLPTIQPLELQQPWKTRETVKRNRQKTDKSQPGVNTNKKPTDTQKSRVNRETHTVKLSLNQTKNADRPPNQQHQTKFQITPSSLELNMQQFERKKFAP